MLNVNDTKSIVSIHFVNILVADPSLFLNNNLSERDSHAPVLRQTTADDNSVIPLKSISVCFNLLLLRVFPLCAFFVWQQEQQQRWCGMLRKTTARAMSHHYCLVRFALPSHSIFFLCNPLQPSDLTFDNKAR